MAREAFEVVDRHGKFISGHDNIVDALVATKKAQNGSRVMRTSDGKPMSVRVNAMTGKPPKPVVPRGGVGRGRADAEE